MSWRKAIARLMPSPENLALGQTLFLKVRRVLPDLGFCTLMVCLKFMRDCGKKLIGWGVTLLVMMPALALIVWFGFGPMLWVPANMGVMNTGFLQSFFVMGGPWLDFPWVNFWLAGCVAAAGMWIAIGHWGGMDKAERWSWMEFTSREWDVWEETISAPVSMGKCDWMKFWKEPIIFGSALGAWLLNVGRIWLGALALGPWLWWAGPFFALKALALKSAQLGGWFKSLARSWDRLRSEVMSEEETQMRVRLFQERQMSFELGKAKGSRKRPLAL